MTFFPWDEEEAEAEAEAAATAAVTPRTWASW